jgi:hypothetical protein
MIKKFPIVVSYYTLETLYQLEVQNLIASCEHYQLETSIEGIPNQGSWEINCGYKPFFILKKLEELKAPVLWVDADAVFERLPEVLPEFEADLATYIDPGVDKNHKSKVRSGTVYVNYTPKALVLVNRWAQASLNQLLNRNRTEEFWDQIALRNVLMGSDADTQALPLEYVKIFDHAEDSRLVSKPVITHYQASRRLKNLVNRG